MLRGDSLLIIDYLHDNITQMYRIFEDNDNWKNKVVESSQFIALTTKMEKLKNDMKKSITVTTAVSSTNNVTLVDGALYSH